MIIAATADRDKKMRRLFVTLVGLLTLAGCSVSLTDSVPTVRGHSSHYALHVATAAPGASVPRAEHPRPEHALFAVTPYRSSSATVDLPEIARIAMRVPEDITLLKRTLLVIAAAVAIMGFLNAALLLRLLAGVRRILSTAPRVSAGAIVDDGAQHRTIASHRKIDMKRVVPLPLPERLILPVLDNPLAAEGTEPDRAASAHLSHAKIGERRHYYIFDVD